jgi:hypothetical protein
MEKIKEQKKEQINSEVEVVKNNKKDLVKIIFFVVVVIIIGGVLVSYKWNNKASLIETAETTENQAVLADKEKQDLLEKINKHILLPAEGNPVIMQIDDAEELKKTQAFFVNSLDGDVLVVYQDKALIYRPSEDVLINVGPVKVNDTE